MSDAEAAELVIAGGDREVWLQEPSGAVSGRDGAGGSLVCAAGSGAPHYAKAATAGSLKTQ